MGGICGYFSEKIVDVDFIDDMSSAISKRGSNISKHIEENWGFANLSHEKEKEIIYTDDIYVVVDGNFKNKESIIELYKKYGESFIYQLKGYYAFALFDKNNNKLILGRDPLGTKPLYYYIDGNTIVFASELKSIIKYPKFIKSINNNVLSLYFRYSYINEPFTIFENTFKLEHGHFLVIKNGKFINKSYWNCIDNYNNNSKKYIKDFNNAKNKLEDILVQNLESMIKDNKKIGVYLSGGVDSSLVTSLLCKKLKIKNIDTFSIGFYEKERNEAEKSKRIAKYLGTNHHEYYINEKDILETVKKVPLYYDEPFADASQIPTIILNEFAKKNGVELAISGDGADQIFCGSTIYDKLEKLQKIHRALNPLNININKRIINDTKLKYIFRNTNKKCQSQVDAIFKEYFFKGLFIEKNKQIYEYDKSINNKSWQVKRMIIDIDTFLAVRLNTKTDRCASNNGINMQSPFLSTQLVEYSFKIPQKYKYYHSNKKFILKEILFDYLPKDLLEDEKKGFGIPMIKWINKYLYDDIARLSEKSFIKKQNIFNYDVLSTILKKIKENKVDRHYGQVLWNYYMFQLWYEKYMS